MPELEDRLRKLDRISAPELWSEIEARHPRALPEPSQGRRLAVAAVALAVAAAAIGAASWAFVRSANPRPGVKPYPITPKANGKIAFSCGKTWPSNSDVCVLNPDGTGMRRLATGGQLGHPSWSPDGQRLLFQEGGGMDSSGATIRVMNADGSGNVLLVDSKGRYDRFPEWSPDGRRIVFSRSTGSAARSLGEDLYIAKADGSAAARLTDGPGTEWFPDWSPDGLSVVFIADPSPNGGDFDLFTVSVADGSVTRMSETPRATEWAPHWSPDGSLIAFVRQVGHDDQQISQVMLIRPDGTDERAIYTCDDPCGALLDLAWSPDGKQIVFTASIAIGDQQFRQQLFVMNADGTEIRELDTGGIRGCCPSWQPVPLQAQRTVPSAHKPSPAETAPPAPSAPPVQALNGTIAFQGELKGRPMIYVLPPGGTPTVLADGSEPAWSPDGTKIAFRRAGSSKSQPIVAIDVMNADGSGLTELVSGPGQANGQGRSAWSPDGTRIAFAIDEGLLVMSAGGQEVSQVAAPSDFVPTDFASSCSVVDPAWAPDGSKIAFAVLCETGGQGIFVANPDGSGKRRLTERLTNGIYERAPAWSPDGSRIAFERSSHGLGWIHVMNADGTGRVDLTTDPGAGEGQPSWSAEGSTIVFARFTDAGDIDVWAMQADGSHRVRITALPGAETAPAWRPASAEG